LLEDAPFSHNTYVTDRQATDMPVAYERDCIKYGRLKTVEIGPARASRQMG